MLLLESLLAMLALAGLLVGGASVLMARAHPSPVGAMWGRRVFVGTMVGLGICGLVAALDRADGLVTISLLCGLLLVFMLWEIPEKPALETPASNGARNIVAG